MNKTYRLIWNDFTRTWVAVSEIARARGKRASGAVLLAAAGFIAVPPAPTFAAPPNPPVATQLPTGGKLVAGQASIAQSAATLTVTQSSNRAAIDWQTFNVGSAARVNFIQPSSSAAILNRVLDPNPSQIFGRITANGQVFLTNSSGIYFSPTANVNVGALTATTHSISNDDFMAGRLNFARNGATGKVENEGSLTADLNGYIALLAPEVRNSGVIVAQLGTVALAAGEAYELQFDNNRLTNIRVEPATIAALVENGNAVQAPGGLIILSAQAANRLQGGVVNNFGSLEASGLVDNGGVIRLEASDRIAHSGSIKVDAAANSTGKGGTATLIASLANPDSVTEISGSISARGGDLPPLQGEGRGGDGGFIETSGGRVQIGADTRVDTRAPHGKTGTWLLDPDGFTIASSGGDISGATLSTNLGTADVSITSASGSHDGTSGNINVNDTVAWNAHLLTLSATNNININADMNATGAASLALIFGQGAVASGNTSNIITAGNAAVNLPAGTNNFTTRQGSDGTVKAYTVITSLGAAGSTTHTDLQGINGGLALNYALGGNIDATATSGWNSAAGFAPIGTFTGTFDGLGHTISGLTVNRPSEDFVGLFGYGHDSSIRNVGLIGGTVSGRWYVGGLVGYNTGSITNSHSSVTVAGSGSGIGGLVGATFSNVSAIQDSYATGTVTGGGSSQNVGGLVGRNQGGSISNSYATGTVNGAEYVGGLVGGNYGGNGGWGEYGNGSNGSKGAVTNSYAIGRVTGSNYVGGLVGRNLGGAGGYGYGYGAKGGTGGTATVDNSYAMGAVSGSTHVGGLVGGNVGGAGGGGYRGGVGGVGGLTSVATSYWNSTTSGQGSSAGGTSLTSAEMQTAANFTGFNFTTPVWKLVSGVNGGYPCLAWSAACVASTTPLYLRLTTGSSTYGDSPSLGYALYDATTGGSVISDATPSGTVTWSTPLSATSAANTYGEIYSSGITLGNAGYTLSAGASINWVINPRPLNLTASKTYNGSPDFNAGFVLTGMANGNSQPSVSGSASVSSANAATYSSFSSSTLALDNGNYTLTGGSVADHRQSPPHRHR